ncbi:MAG: geranylgeranyl reductase family protein [Deltaproteobacteria bacterium]|nr:geranylgeranyl reductase family protein [Deltaproteobacteria bacterium]
MTLIKYDYDVIVVGLGPAGSVASGVLSRKGYTVLGLEKKSHPRHKTCGGCLSARIVPWLEFDLSQVAENVIYGSKIYFRDRCGVERRSSTPIAYTVKRENFDLKLIDQTRLHGTVVQENEQVTGINQEADKVRVHTTKGQYTARYVIGADGATGAVARSIGIRPARRLYRAIENEFVLPQEQTAVWRDTVVIHLGLAERGYGWVFPRGAMLTTGLAALGRSEVKLKSNLLYLNQTHQFGNGQFHGHLYGDVIPCFDGRRKRLSSGRVLLAGDAAGLVEPFIGEGIYYAVRSGHLAASVTAGALQNGSNQLTRYDDLIRRELFNEFRWALYTARVAYFNQQKTFDLIVAHPGVVNIFYQILQGIGKYDQLAGLGWHHLLKKWI